MAIVEYKCDVCKRTTQIPRNEKGLERIQRCIITQGCRGKLYQNNLFEDFVRGSLPDQVAGLNNWVQRKVLHNHEQPIERTEWIIEHNMGTLPTINVFIDQLGTDDRLEIIPENVTIIDKNAVSLTFEFNMS